jgi:hypothetical protein
MNNREYRTMLVRIEHGVLSQPYNNKNVIVDLIKARIKTGTSNRGSELITNPDNPSNVY